MIRNRIAPSLLLCTVILTACSVPDSAPRDRMTADYLRLVELEDMRPTGGTELELLVQATSSEEPFLRATAVRALGRLENPELADEIIAALHDPIPAVRLEATYALAQSYFGSQGDDAFEALSEMMDDPDAAIRGEAARSLGRLRLGEEHRDRAERLLLTATSTDGQDAPLPVLTGALLGLEALLRNHGGAIHGDRIARRMHTLSVYSGDYYRSPGSVRIRTLALTIYGHTGLVRATAVQRALRDDAPEVAAAAMRFFDQIEEAAKPETLRAVRNPRGAGSEDAAGPLAHAVRSAAHDVVAIDVDAGAEGRRPGARPALPRRRLPAHDPA